MKQHKKLLFSLLFLSLYAGTLVFAVPPLTQYTPGETLDPSCAPGDTNCSVLITSGGAGTLDDVTTAGNTTSNSITVGNLTVSGNGTTVPAPTNASATIIYDPEGDDGYQYYNDGYTITYRIYAYQDIGGDIIYSSSYTEVSVTDNGNSDSNYGIQLSWDPAPNADGYRMLMQDLSYNGYNFDAGYDTTSTTVLDDACNNVCFNGGADADVTPTTSYSNTNIINGGLTLSGPVSITNGTLDVNGDAIISGSSRYLNFGTTSGVSGYGFRDNAGTLEWKNNAGSWSAFGGSSGWGLTGNAGTDPSTNFIGTTDDQDVVIKRNNLELMRFLDDKRILVGESAGVDALNYTESIFFGRNAGKNSTNSEYSIFFGSSAGQNSNTGYASVFIGYGAGSKVSTTTWATFIGGFAGYDATNASNSNLIGYNAGLNTTNASYSNLFGTNVGKIFIGNNIGSIS